MAVQWTDVQGTFQHDEGWFCDLVIPGAGGDWQRLLDHIQDRGWRYQYSEEGAVKPLPAHAQVREARQHRKPLLTFWPVDTLPIDVHFFMDDEVEATFDPRCVSGQPELDALTGVMRSFGTLFNGRVAVTVESQPQMELLSYEPTDDAVHVRG